MKLSFTRKPAHYGQICTRNGVSAQFFERNDGVDCLKITSDSPRQVIEVPVSLIERAMEAQWQRDEQERSARYVSIEGPNT